MYLPSFGFRKETILNYVKLCELCERCQFPKKTMRSPTQLYIE